MLHQVYDKSTDATSVGTVFPQLLVVVHNLVHKN